MFWLTSIGQSRRRLHKMIQEVEKNIDLHLPHKINQTNQQFQTIVNQINQLKIKMAFHPHSSKSM